MDVAGGRTKLDFTGNVDLHITPDDYISDSTNIFVIFFTQIFILFFYHTLGAMNFNCPYSGCLYVFSFRITNLSIQVSKITKQMQNFSTGY